MANVKVSTVALITSLVDADALYVVQDQSGTPSSKIIAMSDVDAHIEAVIAAMVAGNVETLITVTESGGKLNFVADVQSDVNFTSALNTKLAGITAGAEVNPALISQAEAEAGTVTTERMFSALRVKQAIVALSSGAGDVVGPASAVDNALARFDNVTGKIILNSLAILDDAGALSGLTGLIVASLTYPTSDGTNGQVLTTDGAGGLTFTSAGSGDVVGPAIVVDNAMARYDLTTGKLLQTSLLIIDDSGNASGIANITLSGTVDGRDVAADGTKLDGIASSANAYVHPNHSGDVTSVADGAQTIAASAVTLAKMANMATASLLGRNTAGIGVPEVLSASAARTLLNVENGATADQSDAEIKTAYENNTNTNEFSDAEQTKLAGIAASANNYTHPNHSGDVTSVADGAQTIAAAAVTLAKMAAMATASLLGRNTAGNGDPEVLSAATARTLLNVANASTANPNAIDNIVEDTTPQLGGNLDLNDQELDYSAVPTTDHTAVGPTTDVIAAGEVITIMDLCYLDGTATEWLQADGDVASSAEAKGMLGIALAAGTNGAAMKVALPGSYVRDDTWAWTVGDILYVSDTPGGITATPLATTGDTVRIVGYALTADVIFFNPDNTYVVVG